MAINESFYKNVSLLMQVMPASHQCTKYFQKGMFDKPNTLGFIYTSHYLLSVHNAKRFQKMVTWPIIEKMDERKYRMEIKEYLEVLAYENSDINFPSIQMSHLIQAGGIKILILMWKISELSLRAYITRKCQTKLLQAPTIGDNKEITQTYFTIINVKQDKNIFKFHKKIKSTIESFEHYMQCKSNDLAKVQTAIFEAKHNIEKFVPTLPVSSLIAKRFRDTDDIEIINLWKKSIEQNIKFLRQKYSKLEKLKSLSDTIHGAILNLCVNSKSFDASDLPEINNKTLSLCLINNIQLVNNGLYINGCLVFHVLLSIFDQILKQIEYYLKADELPDLSNWGPKIIEYYKTVKSMEEIFQNLIVQVSDDLYDVQYKLQEETINDTLNTDFLYPVQLETVLTSPKFNFIIDEYSDEEKIAKKILVSPLKGKYKQLFKRYRYNHFDSSKRLAVRYQFNDSIESITSNWKSPQKELNYRKCSPNKLKVSPRYSRLFSTSDSKRNYFRDNNAASTPKLRRSITPKKSTIQTSSKQMVNINAAMKNIFDLSCKITDVVVSLSDP